MTSTPAKQVNAGGDPIRRITDAVNQHAKYLNAGFWQTRTVAELANEAHEDGRSFYVPNNAAGPCIAVSSSGVWRQLLLGATVA